MFFKFVKNLQNWGNGRFRVLQNRIVSYGLGFSTSSMTLEELKDLAQKYINPDKMVYLIAGDKATQLDKLKELGFGDPILLDKEGNIIKN